jgi:hypothetical protein
LRLAFCALNITSVLELSPKLKYPARLVALASARLDGVEGWVVLDGTRSAWYPKSEQPDDTFESAILQIHVGRQLLGFHDLPDRKQFLVRNHPSRKPQEIITAYEKLVAEVSKANPTRQRELLGSGSLLGRYFDVYIDALAAVKGRDRQGIVLEVYSHFLRLADCADTSIRKKWIYDIHGVLGGDHFSAYVDALVSKRRSAEVAELVQLFEPYWNHNYGYGMLGTAAFKARQWDIAERFCLKVRDGLKDCHRSKEMSLLAEIWHGRGEADRASELLVNCMIALIADIQQSKLSSDRSTFAEQFRHHRSTYLRLFPDGRQKLTKRGIPSEPL